MIKRKHCYIIDSYANISKRFKEQKMKIVIIVTKRHF